MFLQNDFIKYFIPAFLIGLLLSQVHAHAKTYSAVIDDGTPIELSSDQSAEEAVKKEIRIEIKTTEKTQARRSDVSTTYDSVPEERVGELSERIKYAYELLKKHGRAYDYRTTTLTKFKEILASLEEKK